MAVFGALEARTICWRYFGYSAHGLRGGKDRSGNAALDRTLTSNPSDSGAAYRSATAVVIRATLIG